MRRFSSASFSSSSDYRRKSSFFGPQLWSLDVQNRWLPTLPSTQQESSHETTFASRRVSGISLIEGVAMNDVDVPEEGDLHEVTFPDPTGWSSAPSYSNSDSADLFGVPQHVPEKDCSFDQFQVEIEGGSCADGSCVDEDAASAMDTPLETPVMMASTWAKDAQQNGFERNLEDLVPPLVSKRKHCETEMSNEDNNLLIYTERPSKSPKSGSQHVQSKPEMSARAREAQAHWSRKRDELRRVWEERQVGEWDSRYVQQVKMCAKSHTKSQHECLLRLLQIAALERDIVPLPFRDDDENSFLGWTGFKIAKESTEEFRRRIVAMFPRPPKDNTLNNCFRRAGFGPSSGCWDHAWLAVSSFEYDPSRRQRYPSKVLASLE